MEQERRVQLGTFHTLDIGGETENALLTRDQRVILVKSNDELWLRQNEEDVAGSSSLWRFCHDGVIQEFQM